MEIRANPSSLLAKLTAKHPVLAAFLILFFGTSIVLGSIHETVILADVGVVLIRHVRQELHEAGEKLRELKREITALAKGP